MSDWQYFVLGIVASVPLSIFANLMTPRWQSSWSRRSSRLRARNDAKRATFDQLVTWLRDNPSALNAYLLREVYYGLFLATAGLFSVSIGIGIMIMNEPGGIVTFAVIAVGTFALFSLCLLGVQVTRAGDLVGAVGKSWPIDFKNLGLSGIKPQALSDPPAEDAKDFPAP